MARMMDLILAGNAPPSIMRRAAQGGLSLPANEAIEILVALTADRELGAEAEQTLESWDEASLIEVVSDTQTPTAVLTYILRNHASSPAVIRALCDNPELSLTELEPLASRSGSEVVQAMMRSVRVRSSSQLLEMMATNPAAQPTLPTLTQWIAAAQGKEAEGIATSFLERHAEEVAREDANPFELVASPEGEDDPLDKLMTRVKLGETTVKPEEVQQLSLLQKIGRMKVGERIKLAVRGNREERMVLIRDRSKLVSLAVLESPKVNDSEMETFAAMKNVQETVLRAISTKRSYIKNYGVLRTLVNNPKAPLDVGLPLVGHLLIKDLRALAVNKNVNETVRKQAMKLFRAKTERKSD